MYDEDTIETFIRENKDKFGVYRPSENHLGKFLFKINSRIRHFINIVPYLVRVSVATILIFAASITIWNEYIRKDRHIVTFKNKISLVIKKIISN
jgi:hypothetical protein